MSNLESLDWDDILSQPNDEWYCPQILESAQSGIWVLDRFPDGNTALHVAANLNLHKNIDSLLQTGANINMTNSIGHTALFNAIIWDNLEFAYKLITNQMQPISLIHIDFDGKTAFDYCEHGSKCFELYETLVNKNKIPAIDKHEEVRMKEEEVIIKLNTLLVDKFTKGKLIKEKVIDKDNINTPASALFDDVSAERQVVLEKMPKREVIKIIQDAYPKYNSHKVEELFYYLGKQKKHPYLKIQTQFNIINQGNNKSKSEFLVMVTERFVPDFI